MKKALAIARKELQLYFGSPMALIFVGVFLLLTLFVFFWVDSFFARGIADVRALFAWMPLLMILLVAALTMHQWSREEESGNLQVLLTLPLHLRELIAGKFLSALLLMALSLALTLFLPITVASLGNLDWGPVIGGYLAALMLASSYIAIGLFVSSRTDNQLVALIGTAGICALFQAIGSPVVTDLFGTSTGDILRQFGTGSRFESIERGVIDLRDLLYYLSLTLFFLGLNALSLESKRWSSAPHLRGQRRNGQASIALLAGNLLALNLLLAPVSSLRLDLTQYGEYSLADVTRSLLAGLSEPLLIRGYFSEDSHPALAPLVPRVRDTLREYELAAQGQLQLDFVDPLTQPELEREANQVYGIRPTPLQVSDRGGVSLVNVYFDILIAYGDQNATLNFADLIEITETPLGAEVGLRNLEYDLTSAIQRAVYGFQSLESVLAGLDQPAQMTLFLSSATLPDSMVPVSQTMQGVAQELASAHPQSLQLDVVDMSLPQPALSEQELLERYQIQPVAASFFATETFYMHLLIEAGGELQVIYPTGALSEVEIRNSIEAAIKRSAPGFLKVVGIWLPPTPQPDPFGQQLPSLQQYSILEDSLGETVELRRLTLEDGKVADDIDLLLLLSPYGLSELQRYAIDQHIMRGGAVIAAAGQYRLGLDPYGGNLLLERNDNGIADLLAHYGIALGETLIMDEQNAPFPLQVQRDLGDMVVSEIQALDYPYFIDIRPNKMDSESAITQGLPLLTMSWASTLDADAAQAAGAEVRTLFSSSDRAWESTSSNPLPDLDTYPDAGFAPGEAFGSFPLALTVEGAFDSYFADKPSPFTTGAMGDETAAAEPIGLLERSPDGTRLVLIGSAEFLNDNVYQISASFGTDRFFSNIQLVQNAIEWFTQDASLATIRSRGRAARILPPLGDDVQNQWVLLNVAVALVGLLLCGGLWQLQRRAEQPLALIAPAADASQGDDA